MKSIVWMTLALALLNTQSVAQVGIPQEPYVPPQYGYGQEYIGSPTPSASEPLFKYDDLEAWKHGWIQINPYEHGYHSYRPYNYKHVLSQAAQSSEWGMPSTMPYSQSYYLRHGRLTGIDGVPLPADVPPTPTSGVSAPAYAPAPTSPMSQLQMPASTRRQTPSVPTPLMQLDDRPGLTELPGNPLSPEHSSGAEQPEPSFSPTGFSRLHENMDASRAFLRQQFQKLRMQSLLDTE